MSQSTESIGKINYIQAEKSKKFVLFTLDKDIFAVPVEQVSQVIKYEKVFPIPKLPDYALGAINIRGKIITLIHLRKRLNLGNELPAKGEGQIIFVDFSGETVGMLCDSIHSLKNIPITDIRDNLDMISDRLDMEFLKGAAIIENEIIILINLDMILSEYEIEEITHHRDKLQEILQAEETFDLTEETLLALDLESDDFNELSDNVKKN